MREKSKEKTCQCDQLGYTPECECSLKLWALTQLNSEQPDEDIENIDDDMKHAYNSLKRLFKKTTV